MLNRSTGLTRRQLLGWLGLSVAVWGIVALIILPPYVGFAGREIIMAGFRPLCHQIGVRSPFVDGVQLAVCHRCFGIYVGLAVSASLIAALIGFSRPLEPYAKYILPASLIPLSVDWLGDIVGIWVNTPESRTITGAIFGAVGGVYLTRAVVGSLLKPTVAEPPAVGRNSAGRNTTDSQTSESQAGGGTASESG